MKKTAEEIKNIIENSDCEYFGIRVDKFGFEVGQELENSHQWFQDYQDGWEYDWDGDEYDDPNHPYNKEIGCWDDGELNGTCAIYIDADMPVSKIQKRLDDMKYYRWKGSSIYLIGGDDMESGNDINETIISDAKVLAVIE